MNNRLLVTYATRAGSTAGMADAISLVLRKRGFSASVKPIKEHPSVTGYQAVIIGSAIRQGHWLPEAITFLSDNREELRRVRVALFTVHMLNRGDDEISRRNREAYLDAVRPLVQPVAHVFFPGRIDPQRLSLFDRLLVRFVKSPPGDLQDWDKVKGWAQNLLTEEVSGQAIKHRHRAQPALAGRLRAEPGSWRLLCKSLDKQTMLFARSCIWHSVTRPGRLPRRKLGVSSTFR